MMIPRNLGLSAVVLAAFAASASASSLPRPASLLVFPQFDNTRGLANLVTVTNTNDDQNQLGNLLVGTVDVEFVYINGANCQEFNRTRRLTPNDTITVLTGLDNPNQVKGYVYVFAKSPTTGKAISWNFLVGDSYTFDAARFIIGRVLPIGFAAIPATGAVTDLDNDGRRDLNGLEYDTVEDQLIVPSYYADGIGNTLILLDLSGGFQWTAIVDFLVYNNNEEVFSAQYDFKCWAQVPFPGISGVFSDSFFLTTNYNVTEFLGSGVLAGWFKMNGNIAFSSAASISDPAILAATTNALLLATTYGIGSQTNGDLLNQSIFPDTN